MTSPAADPDRDDVWTAVLAHRDRALRVARARCSNPADVEDCVQEGLARVVAMPNVDLNRVGPLLSTVVANVAIDTYRAGDRSRRLQDRVTTAHVEAPSPDDDVCDAAEARWLRDQLAQLRQRDRAVLALRADGYSLPEAAAELGITYKAAESAYTRARNSMKTLWRVTLGAIGVLFGNRLHKDLALGGATVAVAAVVVFAGAAVEQPADAAGHAPGAGTVASASTAADTPRPAPDVTRPQAGNRIPATSAERAPRSAAPREVVARSGVSGQVEQQVTVRRDHQDETAADTILRCVNNGITVEPTRVRCR